MSIFHMLRGMAVSPIEWFMAVLRHRGLFKEFLRREIYGRFAGSIGGSLWLIATPLSQIMIYSFVFSVILEMRLSRQEVGTESFVVFLLAGMFPWMGFSEGLIRCTNIMLENANLITKVVFPVELLPTASLCSAFILNGFGLGLFMSYLIWTGFASWTWLWLPVILLLFYLFALGLAAFLSALCVFLRDIQQLFSIIIFVWFYLTPILYPVSMVPADFQPYLYVNPVFPFIEFFRQVLLCKTMAPTLLCISTIWTGISLFLGVFFFERIKNSFADVL